MPRNRTAILKEEDIVKRVIAGIETTVNKFREHPYYFFTESDIVSYLWRELYSSHLEVENSGRRMYLVHREYPTNFTYEKKNLGPNYIPDGTEGSRGHYDLVILNPQFAANEPVDGVVFKRFNRSSPTQGGVLIALEFKYVIKDTRDFCTQVCQDNHILRIGREKSGTKYAANLVFCNYRMERYRSELERMIQDSPEDIPCFLIQAWYEKNTRTGNYDKRTPKPLPSAPATFLKKHWTKDECT